MSDAAQSSDPNDIDGVDDLGVRLNMLETKIDKVYRPVIKETIPELQDELTHKDERISELEDEVAQLNERLEGLLGVESEDASTHDKRVQDTKQILQRRASANDGAASLYWREIADSLAEHG
ncbi:hypothetical protein, partial [Streptomyces virens]